MDKAEPYPTERDEESMSGAGRRGSGAPPYICHAGRVTIPTGRAGVFGRNMQ
jgi:hypothetical protein